MPTNITSGFRSDVRLIVGQFNETTVVFRLSILPLWVQLVDSAQGSVHGRKDSGFSARHAENDRIGLCSWVRKSLCVDPTTSAASALDDTHRIPNRSLCSVCARRRLLSSAPL